MSWILIGVVSGTLIAQGFASKEACMGRMATLKEDKIAATKCVEAPSTGALYTVGGGNVVTCCANNICGIAC